MEQVIGFGIYFVTVTAIFAMLAASLDLQIGQCGIVNLGQVVYMGVGAYTTALLLQDNAVGPIAAVVLSVLTGALLGFLMSLTVRNLYGAYQGILTLSLAEVFRIFVLTERPITGGANGIAVLADIPYFSAVVVILAVATYGLIVVINRSPFGRVIRMIREGDRLPEALGKNVLVFKMETMVLAGAIGGLAGSLYAYLNSYISPDDLWPIETFIILAMVVVGGRGNWRGVLLGSILIQVFFVGSRFVPSIGGVDSETLAALRFVVIGALITGIMVFRPQGILAERKRVYRL